MALQDPSGGHRLHAVFVELRLTLAPVTVASCFCASFIIHCVCGYTQTHIDACHSTMTPSKTMTVSYLFHAPGAQQKCVKLRNESAHPLKRVSPRSRLERGTQMRSQVSCCLLPFSSVSFSVMQMDCPDVQGGWPPGSPTSQHYSFGK